MFPELNQLFRKKKPPTIHTLKVDKTGNILQQSNIPTSGLKSDSTNKKYIIIEDKHKLDILGAHYESICSRAEYLGNPQLTSLVHKKMNELIHNMRENLQNKITLTTFTKDNPSHDPTKEERIKHNLTSIGELKKFLKKLSNKVSSGLDEIPNLVLKNLPIDTITEYVILLLITR